MRKCSPVAEVGVHVSEWNGFQHSAGWSPCCKSTFPSGCPATLPIVEPATDDELPGNRGLDGILGEIERLSINAAGGPPPLPSKFSASLSFFVRSATWASRLLIRLLKGQLCK